MDDIVLMQLGKEINKRMPQAVAKIKKKTTSTSIMRSKAMKRHATNNISNSKQRVTFKDEIQQYSFEIGSSGNHTSTMKGNGPQTHLSRDLKVYGQEFEPLETCGCPKVLIVDDEPFNLITLETMLH